MRIMGVDPGSHATGYGVIEMNDDRLRALAFGVVRAPTGAPLGERLGCIHGELVKIIGAWQPTMAAVEDVFQNKNARIALKLGQARGVVILALQQAGVPISEYAPASVKHAVSASGRASKDQVKRMVSVILDLGGEKLASDAADALAVAICHCNRLNIG